jgi:hypothetical protein
MKTETRCSIRIAMLAMLAMTGGVTIGWAQGSSCVSPNYSPDFSSNQGCFAFNRSNGTGNTSLPGFTSPVVSEPPVSTVLRLTPNQGGWASSAWYTTPQVVTNGFSTTFSFQIGSSTSGGINADGIAFVVQNSAQGVHALGPPGCGMGFGDSASTCAPATGGIPNSLAIAFNTFNNGQGVDVSGDSVTIQSCGSGANSVDTTCSLKSYDLTGKINLADNSIHVATVTWTPPGASNCAATGTCSTLDVVVDGVDLFPGGVPFDINSIGLTGSTALVGFTAATGGDNDIQDILNWTFTPQGQSQTGTVAPNQTTPTTFKINGGFVEGSPTSGYDFSAQETTTSQTLQMVVTTIPLTQDACNTLVRATFAGAKCFVYQNGGGQNKNTAVLFEVTCPPNGSCGSVSNPFQATLGTAFNFNCSDNLPLGCDLPPLPSEPPFSFGFPNLTSQTNLPEVGLLKGEGPDPFHPCTPNTNGAPLFQSNQVVSFGLGDTSGSAHGGSGGTTSCWTLTYLTPGEMPSISITQPASGGNYQQGENDPTTQANYSCSAANAGSNSPVGPYLTVATCTGTVPTGTPFDTSTVGPHTFTVQVEDSATNTGSQSVTYNVVKPAAITGASSATFVLGTPGSVSISATGFPVPALSESGALPAGVKFTDNKNGTGTLSGTPTAMGIFPITFIAQNGVGSPATLAFTLTVVSSAPASGTKCNGVYNGTFKGNITVAPGQSCIFVGGGVTGIVTETGGKLILTSALVGGNTSISAGTFSIGPQTTIKGNLTLNGIPSGTVQDLVCGSSISGNLVVQGNNSPIVVGSSAGCSGNIVSGNLIVNANGAATSIYSNTVGGSLLDQQNTQPTQVFFNHITGLLTCQSNSSITGGGNTAIKKQGQCAAF